MDGVKYISWMFWNSRGHASGRWSRMHTLEQGNDRKTLCGRNVPFAFNYDYSPDNDYCTICHKKEKENQHDYSNHLRSSFGLVD